MVEPTRVTTTLTARADLTLGAMYESGRGVYAITELDRDVNLDVELTEGGHARRLSFASLLRLPSEVHETDTKFNERNWS
ncbi:MAG: hypothetical protein MUE69_05465 [Myxococcota bacterium]|nr:hypothetical protein [Myxococcota bacterium]